MTHSEDFPSDILSFARQTQDAAIKACADEKLAVSDYPFASGHAKEVLDEHIARALLAYGQRRADEATERAARVAERMGAEFAVPERKVPLGDDPGDGYATVPATKARRLLFGSSIATAIRSSK